MVFHCYCCVIGSVVAGAVSALAAVLGDVTGFFLLQLLLHIVGSVGTWCSILTVVLKLVVVAGAVSAAVLEDAIVIAVVAVFAIYFYCLP